jgi:hypothetical protein
MVALAKKLARYTINGRKRFRCATLPPSWKLKAM